MVKSILVFLYSCKLWQNSLAAGTMWQCVVKKLEAATREGGGRGNCPPMGKAWSASLERQRGNTVRLPFLVQCFMAFSNWAIKI